MGLPGWWGWEVVQLREGAHPALELGLWVLGWIPGLREEETNAPEDADFNDQGTLTYHKYVMRRRPCRITIIDIVR